MENSLYLKKYCFILFFSLIVCQLSGQISFPSEKVQIHQLQNPMVVTLLDNLTAGESNDLHFYNMLNANCMEAAGQRTYTIALPDDMEGIYGLNPDPLWALNIGYELVDENISLCYPDFSAMIDFGNSQGVIKGGITYPITVTTTTAYQDDCNAEVCPIFLLEEMLLNVKHFNKSFEEVASYNSHSIDRPAFRVSADEPNYSNFTMNLQEPFLDYTGSDLELRIKEDPNGTNPDMYGSFEEFLIDDVSGEVSVAYTHPKRMPVNNDEKIIYQIEVYDKHNPNLIFTEIELEVFPGIMALNHLDANSEFLNRINLYEDTIATLIICSPDTASIFELEVPSVYEDYNFGDLKLRIKEDPNGTNPNKYGNFGAFTSTSTGISVSYVHPEFIGSNMTSDEGIDFHIEVFDEANPNFVFTEFKVEIRPIIRILTHSNEEQNIINFYNSILHDTLPIFKVCSDSSNSIFKVLIPTDCLYPYLYNLLPRIKQDPDGANPAQYGKFSYHNYGTNTVEFSYTHPTELPSSSDEAYEEYELEIIDFTTEVVINSFKFRVYRTPVLMVHGLWGNDGAFKVTKENLIDSGCYENFMLYNANYEESNADSFSTNIEVIPEEIDKLLKKTRAEKIAVTKVDIIGHSMGGILSRLYLQSGDYKENINRLITLNSPHSGSQLPDWLLDDDFPYIETVRQIFIELDKDPHGGALNDLRVMGDGIRTDLNGINRNANKVPSHAIVTTLDIPQTSSSFFTKLPIIASFLKIMNQIESVFNGEQHDLIVPLSSQKGGIAEDSFSQHTFISHSGAPKNDTVNARLFSLLKSPLNSPLFSRNGFHPDTLTYSAPFGFGRNVIENSSASLNIVRPNNGAVFLPNENIPITITGDVEVTEIFVLVTFDDENIYLAKQTGNSFNLTFEGDSFSGAKEIVAVGKTSDGGIIEKNVSIFICPENEAINDQFIYTRDYFASNTINSNGLIEDEGEVVFTAGNSINLTNGFHVANGTSFTARIENCGATTFNSNILSPTNAVENHQLLQETNLLSVYPNPFSQTANVIIKLQSTQAVQLALYDLNGHQLINIVDGEILAQGEHQFNINSSDLEQGMYFLTLKSVEEILTQKVIIDK